MEAKKMDNCTMHRQTPYLLIDLEKVTMNYARLKKLFQNMDVHYAMKCNPAQEILKCIKTNGGSFEIASIDELKLLIATGINPRDVLFSNPVKIESHITQAAEAGVYRFAFDSKQELEKISQCAPGASIYVRLATSQAASAVPSEGKFGIDIYSALKLMEYAKELRLKPYGITFHVGSQMNNTKPWDQSIQDSSKLMRLLREKDILIEMLDLGGGFPSSYIGNELPLADFSKVILRSLRDYLPYNLAKVVIEPGRALVADAGVMVSEVIGVAERHGKKWVHLDIGAFNGMMEALETQNNLLYPLSDSKNALHTEKCNVTGPSCDTQDTILYGSELSNNLTYGDKVYIHSAGAYTTSYASHFNGFDIPEVYIKS